MTDSTALLIVAHIYIASGLPRAISLLLGVAWLVAYTIVKIIELLGVL